jgi:hypothetical protein
MSPDNEKLARRRMIKWGGKTRDGNSISSGMG